MGDVEKIPDPDLRSFANSEKSDTARSVIVELEGEAVEMRPQKLAPPAKPPRKKKGAGGAPLAPDFSTAAMSQLEQDLESLGLSEDLVRLNAAQAFVLTASPEQLRALVQLPLVGVIRPNRMHRVPSPGDR